MLISKHSCAFAILSTLVGLAAGSTGCSASPSDNPTVSARAEVINHTKSALNSGDVTAIGGTYGALCTARGDGTQTWSVDMTTPNAADLTVVKDDLACVLTMTSVSVGSTLYIGSPAIPMTDAWAAGVSAFRVDGDGAIMFYGNAMLDAVTFAADFHMTVSVSDDVAAADAGSNAAGWATRSGSATAGTVPASNYTISFDGFHLTKNVSGAVDAVSGYAQLSEPGSGAIGGEDYAIVTGAPTSFDDVDAAWKGTDPAPISGGSIAGLADALRIPALSDSFGLLTTNVTSGQTRTVIIRHTDADSGGVFSYQTFAITFTL